MGDATENNLQFVSNEKHGLEAGELETMLDLPIANQVEAMGER